MMHGSYGHHRPANNKAADYARMSKDTSGRGLSAPNSASQLAGVTIDSGYGSRLTNLRYGAGVSTRGSREAFGAPAGPGGRW